MKERKNLKSLKIRIRLCGINALGEYISRDLIMAR